MSRRSFLHLVVLSALLALPSSAQAREGYVANSANASVSVIETSSNASIATIAVGQTPVGVAITPDGFRAYVTNSADATVSVIDTASKGTIGSPIAVGEGPSGIAISPDGSRAYVSNTGSDSVSVIDTATGAVTATVPLAPDSEPEGIAVAPDGATVYVAQKGGDVARIVAGKNTLADPIATATDLALFGLSLTTDGQRAFVTNSNSSSTSILATAAATIVGAPILVGPNPSGVAVNPNGPRTYVAVQGANSVVAIHTSTHTAIGAPIPGFQAPAQIALAPDGNHAYVTDEAGGTVTVLDTLSSAAVAKIGVGTEPRGIALVPDQPPRAAFSILSKVRAEKATVFDASASTDPDGSIATYSWHFGDGEQETTSSPVIEHVYAKPGQYTATLTLADAENCSSTRLFTGQTVSCNGSGAAITSASFEAIDVTPPSFNLFAAPRQPLRRYVVVVGRCPLENCRMRADGRLLRAFRSTKRRVKGRAKARPARALLENGIEQKLKLWLPARFFRAARRALANGGRATVKIRANALDQAGNARRRKATVHLFEPRRRSAPQQPVRKRVSSYR